MTTSTPSPRRPGGQPGNTNALRHGLYSRRFRKLELQDLRRIQAGLEEEIAMLRVYQARLFAIAGDLDQEQAPDIDTAIKALNAFGSASIKIATLLKAHMEMAGGDNRIMLAALAEALKTVQEEMGI